MNSFARLVFLLLLAVVVIPVQGDVTHAVGFARDIKTGNLRYIEHHQWLSDGTHRIDYYAPDLSLIAFKSISFPGLPQHPQIEQADFTRNVRATTELIDGQIRVTTYKDEGGATAPKVYFLPRDESLVLDAGFDAWIKANWPLLLDAGYAPLTFAIAGVERTLAMTLTAEPRLDGLLIRITPKNWFVALLVPEMQLHYDSQRRLMRFEGYSNLVPHKSEGKILLIDYKYYRTEELLPRLPRDWRAHALPDAQE